MKSKSSSGREYTFGAIGPDWMNGRTAAEIRAIRLLGACLQELQKETSEEAHNLCAEITRYFE